MLSSLFFCLNEFQPFLRRYTIFVYYFSFFGYRLKFWPIYAVFV